MSDLISRKAVFDALIEKGQNSKRYKLGEKRELDLPEIIEAINAIPSAEPEERTAKVKNITHVRGYPPEGECSNCGFDVYDDGEYCPGCGARLEWE